MADGRIWESAGLAQYPKVFMPDRWYVACPACFHVDVADTFEDVPSECRNCGSKQERRKRKFVEPRGFVTSADKNRGRDASVSRRRVKPADEARLIAAPRSDQFLDTDLPFLQTAFLSARAQGASGMRGSLFIANRGSYGEGYMRCGRCNFCQPVKPTSEKKDGNKTKSKKFIHTDPSTGQRCPNDEQPRLGVDFAHQFDTDVRLLRFLAPLPGSGRAEESARRFHERLARTLAEALRLSVTDLLDLYPGELRAIYRLYPELGDTLEVVLYDGVPGGAGYSERLGQPGFSFADLLSKTRQRLDCPAHCDFGCRACLCDYGNQRHWDSFDRRSALAWLDNLLDPNATPAGPGNYVRWTAPSLGGLSERFRGFGQVSVVGNSLVESELDEASLNLLLEWLRVDKEVRLYVLAQPEERPRHYAQLVAYRHLYPYIQDGRLKVFHLPEAPADLLGRAPRMFASLESGSVLVRQSYPVQPLLSSLLMAPADIGAMDDGSRVEIEGLLQIAEECSPSIFGEGKRMALWEYAPGQERDFAGIFAALNGAHIKRLTIRDPYCGTEQNRPRLKTLLEMLVSNAAKIEEALVHCREVKDRNGNVEFRYDVARHIESLVEGLGVPKGEAFVKGIDERSRAFHDRELSALVVGADGQEAEHRYFLTGGVDFLFDKKSETRVFYLRVDK